MFEPLPLKEDFDEVAVEPAVSGCEASPELVAAFEKSAIKVVCSDVEILFRNGEPSRCVYLVLTGEIGLVLPLSSMDELRFRAPSGSLVGLPAAFSNGPYSMTAIAWKGAELAVMSRDKFCDMVALNPAFSRDVLRILAAETRAARIAIVETGIGRRRSRTLD
jgi:CRP-like cAMP-binding protein